MLYHIYEDLIEKNVYVKRTYPLLDVYFQTDEDWMIMDYQNVFSTEEQFRIICNKQIIESCKEYLCVDSFPVGRSTFPENYIAP